MTKNARPSWWMTNQKIRDEFDLPKYDAPKFSDGDYTYDIIQLIEEKYECNILLVGMNTKYGDDWEIRINGESIGMIGRYRNEKGNTIYEMSSSEFHQVVSEWFDE